MASAQPLTTNSYYRSQLYTAYLGLNPLITAAHPLFSIIERIQLSNQNVSLAQMGDKLDHELKAFCARAKNFDYSPETITAARYLICATLDEAIAQKGHQTLKLTGPTRNQADSDTNFMAIIKRTIDKPMLYLDLLELAYLCLVTGFNLHDDSEIKNTKESLYQTISTYRSKKEFKKLIDEQPPKPSINTQPTPLSWQKISLVIGIIFTTCFIGSEVVLNYYMAHQAPSLTLISKQVN